MVLVKSYPASVTVSHCSTFKLCDHPKLLTGIHPERDQIVAIISSLDDASRVISPKASWLVLEQE